ncbi:hypothetical protein J7E70_26390 [Variovorax paradoxus]|nr:hypothetical protein [Variovorax paradoxus]
MAAASHSFGLSSNPAAAVPSTAMAQKFNRADERALAIDELRTYLAYVAAHPSTLTRLALLIPRSRWGPVPAAVFVRDLAVALASRRK